ncbi:hypothetical protein AXG93_3912s1000 [Marchantia polymorpha subsp. ruderalis]|uniref:Uncharacterized protein n=1 Tax=Marchantia polymorpha subsp. ruderalis TaxID=1480154 RepID=A0A176VYB7_MARPO|nr:hypothetical protein AXG93_3912s1000 [Marchantia polymorpha subsp. ruderalis]
MEPCTGSNGDLLFEKSSVELTLIEEFSYGPLFNSRRQGTNGWNTADYKDSKRRAIALGIMHILQRTTVEKTVAPIVKTPEVKAGKSTRPLVIEGPSAVLIKVPADITAEPLKEGTEMVSSNSLSSEQTRSVGSEEVPQPKTSEELVKELTLSEEILKQVVAQVGGTVIDAVDVTSPSSPVEDVRHEVEKKTSEEESKGVEVTVPDF